MVKRVLFVGFILLILLNIVLGLRYFYLFANLNQVSLFRGYKKAIDNNVENFYTTAARLFGKTPLYLSKGINVEEKLSNEEYVYSLPIKILDINLSREYTALVQDIRNRIFSISLDVTETSNEGLLRPSIELYEIGFLDLVTNDASEWKRSVYFFAPDKLSVVKEILCSGDLVYLVWGDKRPISYWEDFLTSLVEGNQLNMPNARLHIVKGYSPKGVFGTNFRDNCLAEN